MYFINNMVVMDHYGFFIYLNFKYPKSYHDGNILHQFDIHKIWCQYCVHIDEYLFSNLGYMGKDIFMMFCIGRHELVLKVDLDVIKPYNKMHTCFAKKIPFHFISFEFLKFYV